jgi:hypothetical protein
MDDIGTELKQQLEIALGEAGVVAELDETFGDHNDDTQPVVIKLTAAAKKAAAATAKNKATTTTSTSRGSSRGGGRGGGRGGKTTVTADKAQPKLFVKSESDSGNSSNNDGSDNDDDDDGDGAVGITGVRLHAAATRNARSVLRQRAMIRAQLRDQRRREQESSATKDSSSNSSGRASPSTSSLSLVRVRAIEFVRRTSLYFYRGNGGHQRYLKITLSHPELIAPAARLLMADKFASLPQSIPSPSSSSSSSLLSPSSSSTTPPIVGPSVSTEWSCDACTFLNTMNRSRCEMCNGVRPASVIASAVAIASSKPATAPAKASAKTASTSSTISSAGTVGATSSSSSSASSTPRFGTLCYEANVDFYVRFMVDNGLVGGGWATLPHGSYTFVKPPPNSRTQLEARASWSSSKPLFTPESSAAEVTFFPCRIVLQKTTKSVHLKS